MWSFLVEKSDFKNMHVLMHILALEFILYNFIITLLLFIYNDAGKI